MAFVVGSFASASEQARLIPNQRVAANVLFFPAPAIVSTESVSRVGPRHPRYAFKGTMDALDAIALSKYERNVHPDLSQLARAYPLPLSPNSAPVRVQPRDDITNDTDDWHFSANPQLGVNHEHEKGMTFSVRHDF
ncbi:MULTISPECIES: hypothetical protein [Caballeronia]|jgi:hypothetical protein|uniref:Uncharacterized protein n=1 Tax=Caballeronia zhejiangensis TaxID=871203 RepID=A0A656QJ21_9BURK|nr:MULTISPECIES: hypothetical protein [Caballeronia]EKS66284.1 hypothetical protein BURK_030579 [Burkholderia sp. SJ98]KDR27971.1 hypothetical protein BG60_15285 [Caballeronia zhejiangensis]MCG7399856.1 hypothetical protein [Caballeronia zhejiangensis]MDR5789153.1 hypothetical protein [Caballeronia sp. LP003]MDR5797803.1 hypothetical protein [Caballeronia sp. LZ008]